MNDFIKACNDNDYEKIKIMINKSDCVFDCESCIHEIYRKGYTNILNYFILNNIEITYNRDCFDRNIYLIACLLGDLELVKFYNNIDENINECVNNIKMNSLILASVYNRKEIVKFLLDKVDINYKDKYNDTALMSSINNIEIFKLLLKNNADMYIKNDEHDDILDILIINKNNNLIKELLLNNYDYHGKINSTDLEIIHNILKKMSSDILSLIVLLNDNYYEL